MSSSDSRSKSSELAILDGTWADKISALRHSAFRHEPSLAGDATALNWGPTDSWSLNFGIISEPSEIRALFRIEKIKTPAALGKVLRLKSNPKSQIEIQATNFPAAIFSRMATDENFAGKNLNLFLRSVAIRACMVAGFENAYSLIKKESWRSRFLQNAGHHLHEDVAAWSDRPEDPELASVLRLDLIRSGVSAIRKIKAEIQNKPGSTAAIFFENENALLVDAVVVKIVAFLKS